MSLTSITLTGTISKNAEQRYTPNNVSVIGFTIMVAKFDNRTKELKSYPVKVNVWGDTASNILDRLTEGTRVLVTGRLQINQFESNGKTIRLAEIECNNVTLIDSLTSAIEANSQDQGFDAVAPEQNAPSTAPSEEIPF